MRKNRPDAKGEQKRYCFDFGGWICTRVTCKTSEYTLKHADL